MKIAIIGSGLSGSIVLDALIKKKNQIYLIDSSNINKIDNIKYSKSFNKHSPKLNNSFFIKKSKKFLNFYNIKDNDTFMTTSTLVSGGGSNFWGGGIEIPLKSYQNKINKKFNINIEKSFYYILNLLCPGQKIQKNNIKNKIIYSQKNFKLKKFFYALSKNDNKDDWYENYRYKSFNSREIISNLIKQKNLKYISNTNVRKIEISQNKVFLSTDNNKLKNISFDKVVLSCGTLASPLLLKRSFPNFFPNKFKIFHTHMLKLAYFKFNYFSKLSNKLTNLSSNLPSVFFDLKTIKDRILGSIVLAKQYPNFIFGISNKNFIFKFLKRFLLIGNLFFDQNLSSTFLKISKNSKSTILSEKKKIYLKIDSKKIINKFFIKNGYLPIPIINFSDTITGSDSHYTSSLFNSFKYEYKFFNKKVYILDGSIIPPGNYYTTFSTLALIRELAKKI